MTISYAPRAIARPDLSELFRQSRADLERYAGRLVWDEATAEDIVSTAFMLAASKMPLDHPQPVGWLFRTIKNLARDEARRRLREHSTTRDHAVIGSGDHDRSDIDRVRGLIDRLPPSDREVLQLTYWDELTAAEASVVVGCSESAYWKRLSRAKARLRRAWGRDAETEKVRNLE